MSRLILLRHGQSVYNGEDRLTGWTDVDLTDRGKMEAHRAARHLLDAKIDVEVAFTSVLKRAIRTLWIVLDDLDRMWVPVECSWRLNEQHYGALQGWKKPDIAREYGERQFHLWRRGYTVRPPVLGEDDARHPRFDRRYMSIDPGDLPSSECLRDAVRRLMPFWRRRVLPRLREGSNVLIVGHGTLFRGLMKHLKGVPYRLVRDFELPTGAPLLVELDAGLNMVAGRYLDDSEGFFLFG